MNKTNDVVDRFAKIHWHDSLLTEVSIRRDGGLYGITLVVTRHLMEVDVSEIQVKFLDVRYVLINIDLLALNFCSGMVWDATCHADLSKELKVKLRSLPELTSEKFNLTGLVVFEINLVPPSGSLLLVAKDFDAYERNGSDF